LSLRHTNAAIRQHRPLRKEIADWAKKTRLRLHIIDRVVEFPDPHESPGTRRHSGDMSYEEADDFLDSGGLPGIAGWVQQRLATLLVLPRR
jgi:hypothetical protein